MAAAGAKRSRGPNQLPPGRHGLSRRFVARNQRERILAGVAEATSAIGYGSVTVQDVLGVAGVSRRTFYELYANKETAFMAAFDEGATRLLTSVRAGYKSEATFEERMTSGLSAFLTILAASPTFATMCIVEVMAAGSDAVAKRTWVMSEFAGVIHENAAEMLPGEPPSPLLAETLVGGIYEAVYRRIARGESAQLPDILPDLVQSALLLYIGEARASEFRAELDRREAAGGPAPEEDEEQ